MRDEVEVEAQTMYTSTMHHHSYLDEGYLLTPAKGEQVSRTDFVLANSFHVPVIPGYFISDQGILTNMGGIKNFVCILSCRKYAWQGWEL